MELIISKDQAHSGLEISPDTSSSSRAHGWYDLECYGADGILKWADRADNALMNEGQFAILDIAFRNGTAPASWFMGMFKNTLATVPATTSTLASLNVAGPYELTAGSDPGYTARQPINRDATAAGWPTLTTSGSGEKITSVQVQWTATANWTDTIRHVFITTIATVGDTTGKLVSVAQLPADRLLQNGDVLKVTYSLALT